MNFIKVDNYEKLSSLAAEMIANVVKEKKPEQQDLFETIDNKKEK